MSTEKTLNEIYAAFDEGRFTTAETLCLRSEVKNTIIGQALLAYTYSALRQKEKCLSVADKIIALKPTDEGVLHTVGCALKNIRADEHFARLYEGPLNIPNGTMDEKMLCDLFTAYIRLNDPKRMQAIANRLYRQTSKITYIFWTVTSMILQGSALPPAMFTVAEKMLQKVFYELDPTRVPGAEELQLYLTVLLRQEKVKEAETICRELCSRAGRLEKYEIGENSDGAVAASVAADLSVPLNDENQLKEEPNRVAMQFLTVRAIRADLYERLGQSADVERICHAILSDLPDQWDTYELLLWYRFSAIGVTPKLRSAGFRTGGMSDLVDFQDWEGSPFSVDEMDTPSLVKEETNSNVSFPQELVEFATFLTSQQKAHPNLRGPPLAELYLMTNLYLGGVVSSPTAEAIESLNTKLTSSDPTLGVENPILARDFSSPWNRYLALLIVSYIAHFRGKPNCFLDIKPVLAILRGSSAAPEIFATLSLWCTSQVDQLHVEIQEHINSYLKTQDEEFAAAAASSTAAAASAATVASETKEDEKPTTTDAEPTSAAKKKRNKKKKASSNAAVELKTIDVEVIKRLTARVDPIILMLCKLAQLDYIRTYIELTSVSHKIVLPDVELVATTSASMETRVSLYVLAHRVFVDGVGGEKRIVQPADDMLLINAAILRNRIQSSNNDMEQWYAQVLQSASMLHYGVKCSTYNYALAVDAIEILSELGAGKPCIPIFAQLNTRSVQSDTLSYLLNPITLRSTEMNSIKQQNNTILSWHRANAWESSDMSGSAFEFANYNKALELDRFVKDAGHSITRATAAIELQLANLANSDLSTSAVVEHLKTVTTSGTHKDYVKYLSSEEYNKLISRLDSCLLERVDRACNGSSEFKQDAAIRNTELLRRLRISQEIIFGMLSALTKNTDLTKQCADNLTSLASELSTKLQMYTPFNQRVDTAESINAISSILAWASNYEEGPVNSSLSNLENTLLSQAAAVFEPVDGEDPVRMLLPSYITSASAFVRCVVTPACILLETLSREAKQQKSISVAVTSCWKDGESANVFVTGYAASLWKVLHPLILTLRKVTAFWRDLQTRLEQSNYVAISQWTLSKVSGGVLADDESSLEKAVLDIQQSHVSTLSTLLQTIEYRVSQLSAL